MMELRSARIVVRRLYDDEQHWRWQVDGGGLTWKCMTWKQAMERADTEALIQEGREVRRRRAEDAAQPSVWIRPWEQEFQGLVGWSRSIGPMVPYNPSQELITDPPPLPVRSQRAFGWLSTFEAAPWLWNESV